MLMLWNCRFGRTRTFKLKDDENASCGCTTKAVWENTLTKLCSVCSPCTGYSVYRHSPPSCSTVYIAFLVDGGMFPCGSFRGMLCGKRRLTSSGLMCMVQMCKSCCVAVRFNTTTTSYEVPSEFVVENLEHFLLIETSWSKITPLDISRRLMELRNW